MATLQPPGRRLRSPHDGTVLRVARPTNDLKPLLTFYRDGLGMRVLSHFLDHAGFDGVILGFENAPYHVEFTVNHLERAPRSPTSEHLLVLYYPNDDEWRAVADRLRALGFEPVRSFNPYWDRSGLTFEDPDGYRTVLQRGVWPADQMSASGHARDGGS